MAKQTFTTGQVLLASQLTSLQQTALGGGAASAKVASYTLVAADAGTAISMSNASPTTITVNTGLFAAGDTIQIHNLGAGVCTVTAGSATVSTSGSLALSQNQGGFLYFNSASAAIFFQYAVPAAGGGGKVLQVVSATTTTETTIASTTLTDTNITATITPTLNTSKILVFVNSPIKVERTSSRNGGGGVLLRGATTIMNFNANNFLLSEVGGGSTNTTRAAIGFHFYDAPATTSATTYKVQGKAENTANSGLIIFQDNSAPSTITLLEIGA